MPEVNWIAVVVATVSTFMLGGLWYGPLFGRPWMRASGISEEEAGSGNQAMIFGVSFILQFVAAAVLAMFIGQELSFGAALAAAASVGVAWVATAFGVVYLFERRPLAHWVLNSGYHIVSYVMMGAIIASMR